MKKARKIAAAGLGVYAGLVALEHSIFEYVQGRAATPGLVIQAIGPPCESGAVWHACFPALTLLPTFQAAGMATVLLSAALILTSVFLSGRKAGPWVMISLSLLLFLAGGGFVPPFQGLLAGWVGTRQGRDLSWWKSQPGWMTDFLNRLWPWALILFWVWFPGSWIFGHLFGPTSLRWSPLLFLVFDLILPVGIALSALGADARG